MSPRVEKEQELKGIIVVNKPLGITSNNVVIKIKKILNEKKVGHLGTLDPLASGVLPICVGKATRLFDLFLKKDKTYIAHFTFGETTPTLDRESDVNKTCDFIPTKDDLENAIKSFFLGKISQTPPIHSSKKIDGRSAYTYARRGEEIALPPSIVTIYDFKVLSQIDDKTYKFLITCSSGTYIRSLARDLGKAVGSLATMSYLCRTRCGVFSLDNAIKLDDLSKESINDNMLPLEEVLNDFDPIEVSQEIYTKIRNGINMPIENCPVDDKLHLVLCDKKAVGLGKFFENKLKITTYLD